MIKRTSCKICLRSEKINKFFFKFFSSFTCHHYKARRRKSLYSTVIVVIITIHHHGCALPSSSITIVVHRSLPSIVFRCLSLIYCSSMNITIHHYPSLFCPTSISFCLTFANVHPSNSIYLVSFV
jgi:hypothetical protein